MMLLERKYLVITILIVGLAVRTYGALTVTTATGGTNISADKAANAASPAWSTLGNIVLTENNNGDFPTSLTSFVINAPSGWSFNTSGSISTTVTGATGFQNLNVNSINITASSITFNVSVGGTNKRDILTIIGIQVRANNGASLPSSGNLTWGSAWLDPLWNGYPLGALSQEVGAVHNFAVEGQWGGNIGTQNATVAFNTRITARDQFNNPCNAGSNVFNGTASITSTGTLSAGFTTGNFTNGVIVHSVTISNGGNFTLTATSGAATGTSNSFLVNNPPPTVSLSTNTTSIAENGGVATLTLTLSNTYYQNVGVNLNIDAGNTTAGGGEYTLASYYVTVTAGNLTATTTITANDDSNYEGDETVTVEITGVQSPSTENGTQFVTITIVDDELPPPTVSLSIDHPTIAENGGVATVTVTLSNTYGQTVGVNLDPTGGTAGGGDYSFTPWYVSIAPGDLTATATITGTNDFVSDPNETVGVFITTVSNGSEDGVQIVYTTIIDDDTPGITVAPVTGLETTEDGGTASFDVVLNTQPTDDVSLTLYSDDTAEGTISTGTLTFTDLDWDTPQTVTITGVPDYVVDGDTPYNIITNAATSTDLDYDAFNPSDVSVTNIDNGLSPSVSFTAASQSSAGESGTLTITAELNMVLAVDVTVPFTVNGSSTATGSGTDYDISASPVYITAGNTTAEITITVTTDALDENNETIIVDMGTPTNAAQGAIVQHTSTITDDDPQPSVSFTAASQSSTGESGTLTITAELSGPSGFDVTVPFTVNGSSTATGNGTDYSITASPVTITAGNTTTTITITITTDPDIEGDETVVVDMGTPTNATSGGITTHTATIVDDDFPAQVIQVSDNDICVGYQITFTAVLSGINCDEIVRYEASTDGGSNWNTVIASPGTTCSEDYTPPVSGTILYRFYYYKNGPNSGYSNEVSVTVNPLPTTPTAQVDRNNLCSDDGGNISLSVTGGSGTTVRWFTGSCGGTDIGTGNPLVISAPTSTTTYYARYENNCGNSACSQVTLTVYPTPQINNPGNQTSCGDYTLPAITGSNLSGNEAYYTGSNGTGTQYIAGNQITSNTSLYIYDNNSGCTDEVSFSITITRFNLVVSPSGAVDCPELSFSTTPAFNPKNSSYNPGATEITFRVEPDGNYTYSANWSFDFNLSGLIVVPNTASTVTLLTLTGDDVTPPQQTSGDELSGTIDAGNNSYVDLSFQVVNTPGSEQSIDFTISNGFDGNACGETETIGDNDATYTLEAMPEVGSFN